MSIVGGLDIHRRQITFDYLDTVVLVSWVVCALAIVPLAGAVVTG